MPRLVVGFKRSLRLSRQHFFLGGVGRLFVVGIDVPTHEDPVETEAGESGDGYHAHGHERQGEWGHGRIPLGLNLFTTAPRASNEKQSGDDQHRHE